jgi:hypothetical protein
VLRIKISDQIILPIRHFGSQKIYSKDLLQQSRSYVTVLLLPNPPYEESRTNMLRAWLRWFLFCVAGPTHGSTVPTQHNDDVRCTASTVLHPSFFNVALVQFGMCFIFLSSLVQIKSFSLFALRFIPHSIDVVPVAAPSTLLLSWPAPSFEPYTSSTAWVLKDQQHHRHNRI